MRRSAPKFTVYRIYSKDGPLVSLLDGGPNGRGYDRRTALGLARMIRLKSGPGVYARGSKS
jgi:hypothetical protein